MKMFHVLRTCLFILCGLVTIEVQSIGQIEDVEINNKCVYSSNKRIFNCEGLDNVDPNLGQFITPRTQMLFLRNSKNVVFRTNHHISQNYANLISYQILNSQYFSVFPGSFLGLVNVQYIEIHGNTWDTIEGGTFLGLRNLEVLNLAKNHIRNMNKNSFNHLKKLKTLDLSDNSIQNIPTRGFEELKELESLYMNNNLINAIEANAFNCLSSLNLLYMTNNSLEHIDASKFNGLGVLEHLSINFNKVSSVAGRFSLPKLQFLQMSNNELTELKEDVVENCPELLSVDLSNNKLRSLTQEPFVTLHKLRHLNLYNNFVNRTKFTDLNRYATVVTN